MRCQLIFGTGAALSLFIINAGPASALTMKECSTKYSAAKQAGTLNGEKWNDFRKAECGATASAATMSPAAGTTPAAPTTAPAPVARTAAPAAPIAPRPTVAPRPTTTAVPTGPVPYPSAVDPRYSSESAGKARMHTCLDSYKAAKASNSLGGSKWIEKGGGYYSACNTKLKGA